MRVWWTSVAAAICLLYAGSNANAYCLHQVVGQNKTFSWQSLPVTYRVSDNLKDAALLQAIAAAFKAWQDVECASLSFDAGEQFTMCTNADKSTCATETVHFDQDLPYIMIFWFDEANKAAFPSAETNPIHAVPRTAVSGAIGSASLAINAFKFQWNATGGDGPGQILDLQNAMTYAIGSVIGLADSNISQAAMRVGALGYGETGRRVLQQDDKQGLSYLYHEAGCADPPQPAADGCSSSMPPLADGVRRDSGASNVDSAAPAADSGSGKVAEDDEGCGCRLGSLPRPAQGAWGLLVLAGGMLIWRWRVRRR